MLKFDKNANPNTELITCESFADKFVKMRSKYNRAIVAKYVQYWKNYTPITINWRCRNAESHIVIHLVLLVDEFDTTYIKNSSIYRTIL